MSFNPFSETEVLLASQTEHMDNILVSQLYLNIQLPFVYASGMAEWLAGWNTLNEPGAYIIIFLNSFSQSLNQIVAGHCHRSLISQDST